MSISWERFKEQVEARGVKDETMIEYVHFWPRDNHADPEIVIYEKDEPIGIE